MPFFSRRRPAPPVPTSNSEPLPFSYTPSSPPPKAENPLPLLPRTYISPRKLNKPLPPLPTSPVSPISHHGPHTFSPISPVSRNSSSRTKLSVYPIFHPFPARYPPTDPHLRVQHFLLAHRPSASPPNVPASPDSHRPLLREEICTLGELHTRILRVLRDVGDVWALQCGKSVVEVHKRKLEEVVEEVEREVGEVRWEFEGLKKAGAVGEEVTWVRRLLREVEREVEVVWCEINDFL